MYHRNYDVGIWGVTGYTGRFGAEFCFKQNALRVEKDQEPLRFAFAGRNQREMEKIVNHLSTHYPTAPRPDIVQATLEDNDARLEKLCANTRVLVSYSGPYSLFGERVVKACIASGTHYIDITAELTWVRNMTIKYGKEVEGKNLKFVSCCGFDFLPSDLMMAQLAEVCASNKIVDAWGGLKALDTVTHTFSQSTPMVSGGTARSGMEMIRTLGFKNTLRWYLDPFALCGSLPNGAATDKSILVVPRHVSGNEYCAKYVMSNLMNKYVHWSNELQGYPYGRNLKYYGGESRRNYVWALLCGAVMWFGFFAVWIGFLLPPYVVSLLLPTVGGGPRVDERSFMFCHLKADFIQLAEDPAAGANSCMETPDATADTRPTTAGENEADEDDSKGETSVSEDTKNHCEVRYSSKSAEVVGSVHLKWRWLGVENYVFAGYASACAAILLASQPQTLPETYGYLPPSVAFGSPLLQALVDAGMQATDVDIGIREDLQE